MISVDTRTTLLHRIDEVRRLCPEMRLGQVMATHGMLGEDATGRSLWCLEDDELGAALERFADDLTRRRARSVETISPPKEGERFRLAKPCSLTGE